MKLSRRGLFWVLLGAPAAAMLPHSSGQAATNVGPAWWREGDQVTRVWLKTPPVLSVAEGTWGERVNVRFMHGKPTILAGWEAPC